jgi:hypothetical protein
MNANDRQFKTFISSLSSICHHEAARALHKPEIVIWLAKISNEKN